MQTVNSEPTEVVVYAAGSLRGVLTALGGCFEARRGDARLRFVFGAAGLLRDRLVAGEAAHVFASANMAHPQALASVGRAGVVHCFARNSLCVLTRMDVDVTAANVLDRLLDPRLRVAISTPTADPSGDYALQLFGKVGAQGGRFRDAEVRLQAKALRLTGGPDSPRPPPGRSVYGALLEAGHADAFVTYRTNAIRACKEWPGLRQVDLPADVNVAADYGVTLLAKAPEAARHFVEALLGPEGQAALLAQGFVVR